MLGRAMIRYRAGCYLATARYGGARKPSECLQAGWRYDGCRQKGEGADEASGGAWSWTRTGASVRCELLHVQAPLDAWGDLRRGRMTDTIT